MFVAITCPHPPEVLNATMATDKEPIKGQYVYDVVVTYTCDENYTMAGKNKLQCAEDGQWEGTAPQCVGMCVPS